MSLAGLRASLPGGPRASRAEPFANQLSLHLNPVSTERTP